MATITAVTEDRRRDGRYAVQLDGVAAATVSVEAIGRLRLAVGRELTESDVAALHEEGEVLAAYDCALTLLAFRDRSAAELRRRLLQKGVAADHADRAIVGLVAREIIDDRKYAVAVVRAKAVSGGASRRRVEQELGRRGVARDVAQGAVEEVWRDEAVDQTETIVRLARKRAATLAYLDPATRRRRLFAFLARRGYDGDEIRRALDVVLAQRGEEDAEHDA